MVKWCILKNKQLPSRNKDEATNLPWVLCLRNLSKTCSLMESGLANGVACGRATWAGSVKDYIGGVKKQLASG